MRTKEEINLLLHDLCTRAPYGVICKGEYLEDGTYETRGQSHYEEVEGVIEEIYNFNDEEEPPYIVIEGQSCDPFDVKPYLYHMEDINLEERKWITEKCGITSLLLPDGNRAVQMPVLSVSWFINWCNEHHVDYQNLIEKNLAIQVTEDNNPYKQ